MRSVSSEFRAAARELQRLSWELKATLHVFINAPRTLVSVFDFRRLLSPTGVVQRVTGDVDFSSVILTSGATTLDRAIRHATIYRGYIVEKVAGEQQPTARPIAPRGEMKKLLVVTVR